jgi:exopolyphosphatase/guanosine-5'-triphosphate,3'-diphosphate pyrophosphatase
MAVTGVAEAPSPYSTIRQRAGVGSVERRDGEMCAALDLGTNNCRLLVAAPAAGGFAVIDAFSRVVRLGEGLSATGRLSELAMDRTVAALRICAGKIRRRRATRVRGVATEACRRASNCAVFLRRITDETGLVIETISGEEEARLGLQSCSPLLDRRVPHALVFDIGGGSTEVSWLRSDRAAPALLGALSIPLGVVNAVEHYGGRRLDDDDYEMIMDQVRQRLERFDGEHGISGHLAESGVQMLGTSGTVTTLTGIHLGLPRYDRAVVDGQSLEFDAIRAITRRLRAMGREERMAQPCVGRDRADLVVAGCAILEAICRTWDVGRVRVADRGLREGILLNLMSSNGAAGGGSA